MEKFETYMMSTSDTLSLQQSFIIDGHNAAENDFTGVQLSDYMYDIGNELHDTRQISNMILVKNIRDLTSDPTRVTGSIRNEEEAEENTLTHCSKGMSHDPQYCNNILKEHASNEESDNNSSTLERNHTSHKDNEHICGAEIKEENTASRDQNSKFETSFNETDELLNKSENVRQDIQNLCNENENDKIYFNDCDTENTGLLGDQSHSTSNSHNSKSILKKYMKGTDNSKTNERNHYLLKKNYSLNLENDRKTHENEPAPRRFSTGVKNTILIPRSEQYQHHPLLEKNENGISELESLLLEKHNEISERSTSVDEKKVRVVDSQADESTEEERSPNEETDRKIEMQLAKRMSFKFQPRISQYERHLLHSVIVDKDKDGKTELERLLADSEQGLDNTVYSESINDFNTETPTPENNLTSQQNQSTESNENRGYEENAQIFSDNDHKTFVAESSEKEHYQNETNNQTAVTRSLSEDKYCADLETELLPQTDEDQTSRKIRRHKFSSLSSSNNKGCCDIL